jgi:hypothetical protein
MSWIALALLGGVVAAQPAHEMSGLRATRPGVVIVAAARDTAAGFRWLHQPERSRWLLVWEEGLLTLPDSLLPATDGEPDLTVPYRAGLRGFSGTRGLAFVAGSYPIEAPLLLDDGRIQLFTAAGDLDIATDQIRYRRPTTTTGRRADYMFLAAIVILSFLLLLRTRSQRRRR